MENLTAVSWIDIVVRSGDRIPPIARIVLFTMHHMATGDGKTISISTRKLEEICGITRKTLRAHINLAKSLGLLQESSDQGEGQAWRACAYTLTWPEWATPDTGRQLPHLQGGGRQLPHLFIEENQRNDESRSSITPPFSDDRSSITPPSENSPENLAHTRVSLTGQNSLPFLSSSDSTETVTTTTPPQEKRNPPKGGERKESSPSPRRQKRAALPTLTLDEWEQQNGQLSLKMLEEYMEKRRLDRVKVAKFLAYFRSNCMAVGRMYVKFDWAFRQWMEKEGLENFRTIESTPQPL